MRWLIRRLAEADLPPEAQWWLVGAVIVLLLAGLAFVNWKTQAGVVARATTKEAVRQPMFPLLIVVALISLVLNTFLPFFSLGEDIKMLKDCGLATLLICGLLLAVWTASNSISAEIEGKTTMTLLSKPVNRRQFVVGKYLGILQAVLLMMVPLIAAFLFLVYFKVGYDAVESSKYDATIYRWFDWVPITGLTAWLVNGGLVVLVGLIVLLGMALRSERAIGAGYWSLAFLVGLIVIARVAVRSMRNSNELPLPTGLRLDAVVQVMPPLVLIILEISVLAAVSVALSTRLPMVLNMVSCLAIFVVGHLTPVLVDTVFEQLEFVKFTAQLIATVLPSLETFNTQSAVAKTTMIPPAYLGLSAIYCAAYATAAMLLAFILFEDRDLA